MVGLKIAYLLVSLFAGTLLPGLVLARRWGRTPVERLGLAVGIGSVLLYLAAWGIYVGQIPWAAAHAVTAGALILGAVAWRQVRELWDDAEARAMLLAWGLLTLWLVALLGVVRHYGGGWTGDWLEHYDRATFFLERKPAETMMFPYYAVTARPPMMNVVAAMFMAEVGGGFDAFQVASAFLNGLIVWPVLLLAANWAGQAEPVGDAGRAAAGGRRWIWLGAAVVGLSPWYVQNGTYTWTKLYSAYFVLLGVWLYLRRDGGGAGARAGRVVLAFVFLTAGVVAHYSAAIYAPFVGLHWAWELVRGGAWRRRWREMAWAVACSAALMMTWAGWSWWTYGFRGTVSTNTTVTEASRPWSEQRAIYRESFITSLVPRALLSPKYRWKGVAFQTSELGKIRDFVFLLYEPSMLLAWGLGGGVAMGWVIGRAITRKGRGARRETAGKTPEGDGAGGAEGTVGAARGSAGFWIGFVIWGYGVGCLVHTPPAWWFGGIAHVVLQPVMWAGLALLIGSSGTMPAWVRRAWWAGVCVDALWILLHFYLQSWTFDGVTAEDRWRAMPLARTPVQNYVLGGLHGATFLGERLAGWEGATLLVVIGGAVGWVGTVYWGLGVGRGRGGARGGAGAASEAP